MAPDCLRGTADPQKKSAQLIGLEPPKQHQLTERYFPKNCEFAKSFTDTKKSAARSRGCARSAPERKGEVY